MRKGKNLYIKLRNISIKNYKGIDSFSMAFPKPMLSEDPDILVMGSENGLGKTSIIECCALLLISLRFDKNINRIRERYLSIDFPDLLIRAGSDIAEITGEIANDDKIHRIGIEIHRSGAVKKIGDFRHSDLIKDSFVVNTLIKDICGVSPNPVIENSFILFHSYRKVQEGNPELGMMVSDSREIRRILPPHRRLEMPFSKFKLLILRSLMNRAELFEFSEEKESEETIEILNELVKFYAGGIINKLRPSAENTVDFRITPENGGESFTFDGLSSGQKEIISTLFIIWFHTKNNPSVVFIDEPELHLNAQWHRSFVNKLIKLAPKNQYIFATHSVEIMDSVPEDHRILLVRENNGE